jgi:hypothetical protein
LIIDKASREVSDMSDRMQELIDHHDIRDVLVQYCHACDRLDAERMAAVYHPESWDDHGLDKMPGKDFAATATSNLAAGWTACMHHLGQSFIRVNGDEAGAETYFVAFLDRTRDGERVIDQLGGRYIDRLQRVDSRWLIKHRVCAREWSVTVPVSEDMLLGHQFVQGLRSSADPSYAALRLGLPPDP